MIDKNRPSAFYGTQLEPILTSARIDSLVVCGVTTNMCVETTARDASQRDYRTFTVARRHGRVRRRAPRVRADGAGLPVRQGRDRGRRGAGLDGRGDRRCLRRPRSRRATDGLRVSSGVRSAATRAPGKVALTSGERSLTYAALVERIDRVANGAAGGLGLRRGDRAR